MGTVYKITGKNATDGEYGSEDEARAAMREPFQGKTGRWEEDRTADGSLKVTFVETTPAGTKDKGKQSWTIKTHEVADE